MLRAGEAGRIARIGKARRFSPLAKGLRLPFLAMRPESPALNIERLFHYSLARYTVEALCILERWRSAASPTDSHW